MARPRGLSPLAGAQTSCSTLAYLLPSPTLTPPGLCICPLFSCAEAHGNPLQSSCLENSKDGEAWWATVHGVAEGRTRLSDFTFFISLVLLEKEMATNCSILAWRVPWTEGSGALQSVGLHRSDTTKQLTHTLFSSKAVSGPNRGYLIQRQFHSLGKTCWLLASAEAAMLFLAPEAPREEIQWSQSSPHTS